MGEQGERGEQMHHMGEAKEMVVSSESVERLGVARGVVAGDG